ncbi:MAG: Ig-like domain-containing protein [Caulobacterales bacterium]
MSSRTFASGRILRLIRQLIFVGLAAMIGIAAQAGVTRYTYDALGRLTSVTNANSSTTTYIYDAAGNRTRLSRTAVVAPTVSPVSATVPFNSTGQAIQLIATGTYSDLSVVTAPTRGTVTIAGTVATYRPNAGVSGADSFTYRANGVAGSSAPATVSITITSAAAPGAGNVSATVPFNSAGTAIALTPTGSFTSVSVASAPTRGTATISGTTATYRPNAGYSGSDSFTYVATGAGGTSPPGTVSITVAAPAAPGAGNVSATVPFNSAGAAITLTPTGTFSSVSVATAPTRGVVTISGTTATYQPNVGYSGPDSFTYVATGPGGTSAPATVSITVSSPPVTDVTPNFVDWIDLAPAWIGVNGQSSTPATVDSNTLTISGLSSGASITLSFSQDSVDAGQAGLQVTIFKNGVAAATTLSVTDRNGQGGVAIGSITVTNGDTVRFRARVFDSGLPPGSNGASSRTARQVVRNVSDGNAILDTFLVSGSFEESTGGGPLP